MRDMIEAALLGVVEALTEFLPVSSTGHLIVAADLLGFDGPPGKVFEVVIQMGAILAVLVLYFRRFWDVVLGLGRNDPGARQRGLESMDAERSRSKRRRSGWGWAEGRRTRRCGRTCSRCR